MHKRLRRFLIGDLIFIGCILVLTWLLLFAGLSLPVALIPAITLITLALALLLSTFVQYRRSATQVRRLVQGEYWVHWHYATGIWSYLATHPQVRAHNHAEETTVRELAWSVGLYTVSAGFIGYFIGILRNSTYQAIQIGLIMASVVLVLSLLAAWDRYRQAHTPPSPDPVDVYIGQMGAALPDRYVSFSDLHQMLVGTQIETGDITLVLFKLRLQTADRRFVDQALAVPVPVGCEAAAQELVERFQTHYPPHI